nr:MAG TPA: restriction endonuclease [Caudoviricetes sp.]
MLYFTCSLMGSSIYIFVLHFFFDQALLLSYSNIL